MEKRVLSLQLLERELRRVLFGENLPHFATLAIRALGPLKGFQHLFTGLREPSPPFALNFWRTGGGGFELRGSRAFGGNF